MHHFQHPARLLLVPGLNNSGPDHWQTWLQHSFRGSRRVVQDDWANPDLARWSERIAQTLQREPASHWVVVAHSFGCLALAHCLAHELANDPANGLDLPNGLANTLTPHPVRPAGTQNSQPPRAPIAAVVLAAPADPLKFGVAEQLPQQALPVASTLVASRTDPWMPFDAAVGWAGRWGSQLIDLGDVGHLNPASGFGPWPLGKQLVERQLKKLQGARRLDRAHPLELSFAV